MVTKVLEYVVGELYLADIGIPPEVFQRLGLSVESPFGRRYWVRLDRRCSHSVTLR